MKTGNNYSIKILSKTEAPFVFSDNLSGFFSHESSCWECNRICLKNILSLDDVLVSEDVLNNISTLKELIFTDREQDMFRYNAEV